MKEPYRFNEKELVAKLCKIDWQKCFRRGREAQMDSGLEKIVDDSVGANTFRAFHHMRQKPSEVFREWAIKALNIRRLQSLRCVRSQKQYIEWLHELQVNFQLFWKAKM